MKREDIKVGGIYKYIHDDGETEIFRANEDLRYCTMILPWLDMICDLGIYDGLVHILSETTEEEKIWFEYCEKYKKYFSLNYVLKQNNIKLS